MSENPVPSKGPASESFWSAISQVIKGLAQEKALLFAFGVIIVLLAAGALALENLRLVAIDILVVFIIAVAAWVLLKAMALRAQSKPGISRDDLTGDVRADGKFDIDEKADIQSGKNVNRGRGSEQTPMHSGKVNVKATIHAKELIIKSGDNIRDSSPDEKDKP